MRSAPTPPHALRRHPRAQSHSMAAPALDFRAVAATSASELRAEVLPFWLRHGLDSCGGAHGGFCYAMAHDGTRESDAKFTWYQGRGAWVLARCARLGCMRAQPEVRFLTAWQFLRADAGVYHICQD